jgi:plastocyanin
VRRKSYSVLIIALIALLALAGAAFAGWSNFAQAQEQTTIAVGDIWFCDDSYQEAECVTNITAGDTVVWDFSGAEIVHTVTHCGESCDAPTGAPLWDSGLISDGSTFSFTFDEAGSYAYHCEVHPQLQLGRIVVGKLNEPTQTPITPTFRDFITAEAPGVTPTAFPDTGAGPTSGGSGLATTAAVVLGGVALVLISGACLRKENMQ